MKKYFFIIPILFCPQILYGATIHMGGGTTGPSGEFIGVDSAHSGNYYKCANSITINCGGYAGAIINYTSQSGGAGTQYNPYILQGCSNIKCACDISSYVASSGGCTSCSNGMKAIEESVSRVWPYHTNTSCEYCGSGTLKKEVYYDIYACVPCPENGTCDGSETITCNKGYYGATDCTRCPYDNIYGTTNTGAKTQTDCYLPKETQINSYDGSFIFTNDCYYTN